MYIHTVILIYNLDNSLIDEDRLDAPESDDDVNDASNVDFSDTDRWINTGKLLKTSNYIGILFSLKY